MVAYWIKREDKIESNLMVEDLNLIKSLSLREK